ncbi:uncharacterized protein LOC125802156 [Astyanax mexicanus]|uniref:uncharacterized protein LOC125802156 n=1 Tax=Astyanax mexicanus TaxID=7994 RepID=UPI0020CAC2CC|nr:uncharacterized protein LOC125802156 [Astyanax mexicanus]XP_049335119.1 uncharacterized protein LOC125802156 [Astyanax mexicanus]XP_049335120.1 uncharacterized protein LOC125802156 [Astyanax mexicanus]XP_049335121.1 uncharacterized protein LOC125802156 [Astyanax mexicanus]
MSVVELEEELTALRERLVREKTEMDRLKNQNDVLTAQLLGKGQTPPGKAKSPQSSCPPSPAVSAPASNLVTSVEVMYVPKDKKNVIFSGQPGTMPFHEWVDELQCSFNFRRYGAREQAAFLYDHLEGEAKQEIRHSSIEIRRNPTLILDTLKEAYGQPFSLTIAQKRFFDRKQKEGEGLREFSHALLSLSEDINRCNGGVELCSDQTVRNQFAENVRDPFLRRELKRLIRQDPETRFSSLRREAILFWEDGQMSGKNAHVHEMGAEGVECARVIGSTSNLDSFISEFRDMLKKQEEKLEGLTQKVEALQMQKGRRMGRLRQEPRFDSAGRPICFKCQGVGHIARLCRAGATNPDLNYSQGVLPEQTRVVGQVQEQQGNFSPL